MNKFDFDPRHCSGQLVTSVSWNNRRWPFIVVYLFSMSLTTSAQISTSEGIFAQTYSREMTEYRVKEFVVSDVLHVPEKEVVEVEINAITASRSGELTTVIFNCKSLNKSGIVLAFWNDRINEFNLKYKGYAFREIELEKAKDLIDNLDRIMEEKSASLNAVSNNDFSNNVVYKWQDITFIFYKSEYGINAMRVFWNGFDSEWNPGNIRATKKRFDRFFFPKKK